MSIVILGGCKGTSVSLVDGGNKSPELTAVDFPEINGDSIETGQVADGETSVTIGNLSATQYIRQVVIDLGAHFLPANICSGKTIFGRAGTAACAAFVDNRFNDLRSPGTKRNTPRITGVIDDDGYQSGSVTKVNRTTGPEGAWAARACGDNPGDSISDRIADCAREFGTSATWDGATKSTVGHGKFVLVARKASDKEVWRDERTGLMWSSGLGFNNWCRAAGVGGGGGVGAPVVDDPNDSCDDEDDQDQGDPESYCAEGTNSDGLTLQAALGDEDWAAGIYDNAKGGLGDHASAGAVEWRLPTREDYLQAYANGIGFVVPDFANGVPYWTASLYYRGIDAWHFRAGDDGVVELYIAFKSSHSYQVRCVGR